MDNIIKSLVNDAAIDAGFKKAFGGWFKESEEVIFTLSLQRSNYSASYYLNIKIYIQGCFGKTYIINKYLIKNDIGDIFRREPKEFEEALSLENKMSDAARSENVMEMFKNFIEPFSEKASTRKGIKTLADDQEISLLPAVREELDKLLELN